MILGSHNSWSYLPVRHWWMKPFAFMAKCQEVDIEKQYALGVRCFDLHVRMDNHSPLVVHGAAEYKITPSALNYSLFWLNEKKDCYVRVILDTRTSKQYTTEQVAMFKSWCSEIEQRHPNIKFWCGKNLYTWKTDYDFGRLPSCEEKYSSVCPPKLLDDWCPKIYAKRNNHKNITKGTDKDILLIDYVNIQ